MSITNSLEIECNCSCKFKLHYSKINESEKPFTCPSCRKQFPEENYETLRKIAQNISELNELDVQLRSNIDNSNSGWSVFV